MIDTTTDTVVGKLSLPFITYSRLAFTKDGRHAYVVNNATKDIAIIDIKTKSILSTFSLTWQVNNGVGQTETIKFNAGGLGLTPDGSRLYVAGRSALNSVDVNDRTAAVTVDVNTNKIVKRLQIPANWSYPYGFSSYFTSPEFVFTPNGRHGYLTTPFDNRSYVFDTISNLFVSTLDRQNPLGVTITPDGKFGYLSYYFGTAQKFDVNTNAFLPGLYESGYTFWPFSNVVIKPKPKQVVLLLHGMNATPASWDALASQFFPNSLSAKDSCPEIYNGKISAAAKPNARHAYCFRVKFGAFDRISGNKGLEDAWNYGETNHYPSAGDYSSFNELGTEIDRAISAIKLQLPSAEILLVGHSRGGLAARAFLQNTLPAFSQNRKSVVGLITTGTPHNGTPMGRVYGYIKDQLLQADGLTRNTASASVADWKTVDFLRGAKWCVPPPPLPPITHFSIDARRPVIGYLADNSLNITALNAKKGNLPPEH